MKYMDIIVPRNALTRLFAKLTYDRDVMLTHIGKKIEVKHV